MNVGKHIEASSTVYTKDHLASATAEQVSRAVAVSQRSLRRLFQESIGLSWRTYLLNARMLRAMALLTEPGQSVQATATAVGFESLSAFTRCFTQFSGQSPSGYRRQTAETARSPPGSR